MASAVDASQFLIFPLTGTPIVVVGIWLLSRLNASSSGLDVAVFGAVVGFGMGLTVQTYVVSRLAIELAKRSVAGVNPQRLLVSPTAARQYSPTVVANVHAALSAALHWVFIGTLPLAALAVVASLLLRDVPLRETSHVEARDSAAEPGVVRGG